MEHLDFVDFLKRLENKSILVFSDGACSGNPGPGGWGIFFIQGSICSELSGGEAKTTNNRMELIASIEAIRNLPQGNPISLTTDSQYVKNGIELWLQTWEKNGWKTSDRKAVKNQDLWKILKQLCTQYIVSWSWVKGHSGVPGNERADALARQAIARLMMGIS